MIVSKIFISLLSNIKIVYFLYNYQRITFYRSLLYINILGVIEFGVEATMLENPFRS